MKKRWQVTGLVHATVSDEVTAETAEEALDNAVLDVSLCHQCAKGLDTGDVYATQVHDPDQDGEIVLRSDDHPDHDAQALEDIRALAAYLKGKRMPKNIRAIVERWS